MKQQIEMFAKCTGNDNPSFDYIDKEYLLNKAWQLSELLLEEVIELRDAILAKDVIETVDAICDIDVYRCQLVSLLERASIDYQGACDAVCENNSLKFTTSAELAERWLNEWQSEGNFNYYISGNEVEGQMYYCLKDLKSKKVKKWKGFPQVDLTPFVPNKFKGKS